MEALKQKIYTVDDIYTLPEGERAELLDGRIYYMAAPSTNHQRISGHLYAEIFQYIQKMKGECEVFAAPFAVFLDEEKTNYVEPDISVVCSRDKLTEKGCNGAPDWIIEIVSPSSRRMDYLLKLLKYSTVGVREYWIVDSEKERVVVHNFEKETLEEYSFGENVPVGIYKGALIKVY